MNFSKYFSISKSIIPTVMVLPWLILSSSCGNSGGPIDEGRFDIRTSLSEDILVVRQGETIPLTVDIVAPQDITVTGYSITFSETEAKISIETSVCAANVGTASCQEWSLTPEASAIPGSYTIAITPNSPDQAANLITRRLNLQVIANTLVTSAPAAVNIEGDNGVWHIRTTDESRWSWNSSDLNPNVNGGAGVGGYFEIDQQGQLVPDSVNPSTVYLAAKDNSNHQWIDMSGDSNQGLSLNEVGEVYSWGNNTTALGYSDISPQLFPRIISDLTNITKVETSESTSFALSNGEIIVWGSNLDGLHGLGTTSSDEDESVIFNTVLGLTNVIEISAGLNHVIALREDGTVWSWGLNNQGQLGLDITDIQVSTPTQITRLSNVSQISAAGDFSLALQEDGTVWSWGNNKNNQLGIASSQDFIGTPQQVTGFTRAFKISTMFHDTISMGFVYDETTGLVWRWGDDLERPTEIPLLVADIGSGLVIDRSCNAMDLPSGERARPGFLWDVRNSPEEPPILLSIFGRNDINCPNKLFLDTRGHGTITASPQGEGFSADEYAVPTQVELVVTANSEWVIDPINPWGGNPDCDDSNVLVAGGIQCIANFIPADSNLLTVSKFGTGDGTITADIAGINCGAACAATFDANETITLTATADAESDFTGWTGTGNCATPDSIVDNMITITLSQESDCQASFNRKSFVLTVSKNGSGDGTIISDITAIDCGQDCDASLDINTQIILTPTPDANSTFASWNGSGDCQNPTTLVDSSINITVTQDSECIATFDPISTGDFILTVIINGGPHAGEVFSSETPVPIMQCLNSGNEDPSTTCTANYPADASVTLVADVFFPNNTLNVAGCDSFVGANLDCFITMDQSRTVTYNISESPSYDLSATITGNGSIITFAQGGEIGVTGRIQCPSINCSDTFVVPAMASALTNIVFEAHPDAGSTFVSFGAGQCDSEQVNPSGIGICNVDLAPGSATTRQVDATFQ